MDMTWKASEQAVELDRLMSGLSPIVASVGDRLDAIAGRMQVLQNAGLIYATEWWRKDRNTLYLLYPSHVGEPRRRDYVGRDRLAIKNARDGIKRAKLFDGLDAEKKHLESRLDQAAEALARATYILTGR
jgi:hypothetical protein